MPSAHGAHIKYAWQLQVDATLAQANPVSGTPYPVLAATEDVMIISAAFRVDWTVQPTPLSLVVTVDGIPITFSQANPATATYYNPRFDPGGAMASQLAAASSLITGGFIIKGQNIAVEALTTGGTVQNLYAIIKWARWLPT